MANTINGKKVGFSAAAQQCLARLRALSCKHERERKLVRSTIASIQSAMNQQLPMDVRENLLMGAFWIYSQAWSSEWRTKHREYHENGDDDGIFNEPHYAEWNDLMGDLENLVAE